jgi:ABC-type nickel/cobalt efflux system permease component RcnA
VIIYLASMQGGIVRSLAAELRAGGLGTATLALALGALHALTPGHGKVALAAYFLGQEARFAKGLRVALSAALLHVLTGFAVFLVLRLIVGKSPSLLGRGSPAFAVVGYGLIVLAGLVMLMQSLRVSANTHDGAHALTAGIGLLPCPLTISVLGFAWAQSSAAMVGLVLLSLALGISLTIGSVAAVAILAHGTAGSVVASWIPQLERRARLAQALAAVTIIVLGAYTFRRFDPPPRWRMR